VGPTTLSSASGAQAYVAGPSARPTQANLLMAPITSGVEWTYAPRLWLQGTEAWAPLSPGRFVNESTLYWAHDQGCNWVPVSANPNASSLASGAHGHQALHHGDPNCGMAHEPHVWLTNEYTSINEEYDTPRPEDGEGFSSTSPQLSVTETGS